MSAGPAPAIKFKSGGEFHREVDLQVKQLLADRGLVRKAYIHLWAKAALVLVWAMASYVVLVFFARRAAAGAGGVSQPGVGRRRDRIHDHARRQPSGVCAPSGG